MNVVEKNSWVELLRGKNLALLMAISAGIGLHAFNQFAIVAALPVAVADIGGALIYSWAYSIYFVGSVAGGVTAILLRERIGARAALVVSALFFSVGMLICAGAGNFPLMILGRGLQGIADGLIVAVCYSLIPAGFRSDLLPKVFAVEAGVWAAASVAGPLLGGFATEHLSWRVTYLLPVPLVLLLVIYTWMSVSPEKPGPSSRKVTWPLVLCLTGALAFSAPAAFEGLGMRMASLVLGLVLLLMSLITGIRPEAGLFPKDAFRPGTVVGNGFWMLFLMSYAQALTSVYLALVSVERWGYEPTFAGFIVVAMPLSWSTVAVIVGSLRSARLRDASLHYGPWLMAPGCLLLGHGLLMGSWLEMLAGQALIGATFGMSWAGINQNAMEAAPEHERKMTGALLPTVATLGAAAGAGASGTIAAATALVPALERGDLSPSLSAIYGTAAVVSIAAIWFGRRVTKRAAPSPL
ncbi:MFS transporter [Agrobacterium sp. rho-8.1]|nr:MFS transporter [Agrobacterium sp. rho-8.1]